MKGTTSRCSKHEIIYNIINSAVIGLVGLVILFINQFWDPFKRGFFCDDESIKYPFKNGTIPSSVLYGVGFSLNIASFIVIEAVMLRQFRTQSSTSSRQQDTKRHLMHSYFCSTFYVLLPFLFGAAVVQLITDIAKYSIGRLRPHFLDVCKPDFTKFNCTDGYITADVCTGDSVLIQEARVSFPSGHASFSMYAMIFLVLYYQARLTCKRLFLLRPLLQLIVFCLAYYTGISRIYDYKHHWSDVLVGDILGVIVAVISFYSLTDLFNNNRAKPVETKEKDGLDTVQATNPVTKL